MQDTLLAFLQDLRSKAKVELFTKDGKPLPKEGEKKSAEVPAASAVPQAEEPAKK
jgi:hypothetical protein